MSWIYRLSSPFLILLSAEKLENIENAYKGETIHPSHTETCSGHISVSPSLVPAVIRQIPPLHFSAPSCWFPLPFCSSGAVLLRTNGCFLQVPAQALGGQGQGIRLPGTSFLPLQFWKSSWDRSDLLPAQTHGKAEAESGLQAWPGGERGRGGDEQARPSLCRRRKDRQATQTENTGSLQCGEVTESSTDAQVLHEEGHLV